MRVLTTEPFPPLLRNQAEIAVITLHKYIDEPLKWKRKFQNYASFVGKSEHFQSSHFFKKVWLVIKDRHQQIQNLPCACS